MIKEMNGWICHYSHETACDGIIGTAKAFEKETGLWIIARVAAVVGMVIAITEINGIADKDMGRLNHRQRKRGKERKRKEEQRRKEMCFMSRSLLCTRDKKLTSPLKTS